jgi:hypothetical protein
MFASTQLNDEFRALKVDVSHFLQHGKRPTAWTTDHPHHQKSQEAGCDGAVHWH